MTRTWASVAVLVVVVAAGAADPIRIELGDFKLAPAFKGGEDLVKYDDNALQFYANGTATAKLTVPADGDYAIVLDAGCTEALKEYAKVTLKVGDKTVKENFQLTTMDQKVYTFDVKLTKGETTLSIAFTNDAYKENEYDRNLTVYGVRLEKK